MHVAVRAAIIIAAVAGIATEVWAIRAGWPWTPAALDLIAGWSLLAAAGWAMHVTGGCRRSRRTRGCDGTHARPSGAAGRRCRGYAMVLAWMRTCGMPTTEWV
jgi:hypothetical protein